MCSGQRKGCPAEKLRQKLPTGYSPGLGMGSTGLCQEVCVSVCTGKNILFTYSFSFSALHVQLRDETNLS